MDRLMAIKIKYEDGTYSDEIPIYVTAENVEYNDEYSLIETLGYIDVKRDGTIQEQINKITNISARIPTLENRIATIQGGNPTVVSSTSEMTDTDKIYILSTDSKWYYYNLSSSAWVAGGVYGGVPTDKTLTQSGMAADAKVTGDKIERLGDAIEGLGSASVNLYGAKSQRTDEKNGVSFTIDGSSIIFDGTASAGTNEKYYFGGAIYDLEASDGDMLTMSYEEAGGSYSGNVYLSLNGVAESTFRLDLHKSVTFTKTSNMSCVQFYINKDTTFDNYKINLQIEKGSEATPFCEYGGIILNDKIARAEISKTNASLNDVQSVAIKNTKTQLVTNRFLDFEQGTFNASGLPAKATYRLRSVGYIPVSVFGKVAFVSGYKMQVYCYAEDYTYLGATTETTKGIDDISFIENQYPTAFYIKFLFANSTVSTITVDDLATAEFKFYTLLSQDNLYDSKVKDGFPYGWNIPYRSIMQMMGTGFSFAVQTDTHYYNGIPKVNYNALKNLSRKIGFDFIAHLGDIIRGYEYDDVSASYDEYIEAISGLVDGAECSTFALMGNHDNGSMYATETGLISNAFLPGELYSLIERPTIKDSQVVWGSREGLYFYRDFDRVRVIVLNTSDLPYAEVSTSDINVNVLKISAEQAEWFSQTALDTDKPVLVLSHAPLDGSNTISNLALVINALEAFVSNGGTVIACVAGHTHSLGSTKKNGINYIICDNGSDICEIFAVNLEARTINTQQIGKDFTGNRSFTF